MKRPLLMVFLCASILMALTSLSMAQKPNKPVAKKPAPSLSSYNLNIRDLTSSEMYRYGREMFLLANYPEATRVFLNMLRVDCSSRMAQYHLHLIAAKGPEYAFLENKLQNLPCKAYDFSKEDFLPASVYYEKDPDIILAQLISYRNRHTLTEKEMTEKIEKFTATIKELESIITVLKQPNAEPALTSAGVSQQLIDMVENGQKTANKLEKELGFLTSQLASQRIDRQKEVQDIRTNLAEAEVQLETADSLTPKAYSQNAKALQQAIEKAKLELAGKEQSFQDKDQELLSLQARFDDIQRRLKLIQSDLANKNTQIRSIQTNLQDIQKP